MSDWIEIPPTCEDDPAAYVAPMCSETTYMRVQEPDELAATGAHDASGLVGFWATVVIVIGVILTAIKHDERRGGQR